MTEEFQDKLADTTAALGLHYKQWKDAEKEKDRRKKDFFALATTSLIEQGLAQRVVDVEAPDIDVARERIEKMHPRWTVDDIRPHEGHYEAIIVENPEYKGFVFENPNDGMIYTRQISKGNDYLDEEWLKEELPSVYDTLTYTLPWGDVVLMPLHMLSDENLAQVQKYIYEGKPSVKLAPPKKAGTNEDR